MTRTTRPAVSSALLLPAAPFLPAALAAAVLAVTATAAAALQAEPIRGTVTQVAADGTVRVEVEGDQLPRLSPTRLREARIGFDAGGVFVEVEGRWQIVQVEEDGYKLRPDPSVEHGEASPGFQAVYDGPFRQDRQMYRLMHEAASTGGPPGHRLAMVWGIGDLEAIPPLLQAVRAADDPTQWHAAMDAAASYLALVDGPDRARALWEEYITLMEAKAAAGVSHEVFRDTPVDALAYYQYAVYHVFRGDDEAAVGWYIRAARGGDENARRTLESRGIDWEREPGGD